MKLSEETIKQMSIDFQEKLDSVLRNTLDPRTDPLKTRSLTFKMDVKPLGDQKHYDMTYHISTRECPIMNFIEVDLMEDKSGLLSLIETDSLGEIEEPEVLTELFPEFKE